MSPNRITFQPDGRLSASSREALERFLSGNAKASATYKALLDEFYPDPDLLDPVEVDKDGNVIIDTDNGFIMIG